MPVFTRVEFTNKETVGMMDVITTVNVLMLNLDNTDVLIGRGQKFNEGVKSSLIGLFYVVIIMDFLIVYTSELLKNSEQKLNKRIKTRRPKTFTIEMSHRKLLIELYVPH